MTEPAGSGVKPTMYCRGCWYVLDGLTEPRCPECGRPFDPARRRSYRTKPRGRWWLGITFRAVAVLASLLVAVSGWLYWQYMAEQRALLQLKAGTVQYKKGVLDWPPTVDYLEAMPATDADLKYVRGLPNLVWLNLSRSQVSDAGLTALKGANLLRLSLGDTQVTGVGLRNLGGMPTLRYLDLDGVQVTDRGLSNVTALPNLHSLWIRRTSITDAGLIHVAGLHELRSLNLLGNTQMTDAGMVHLTKLTNLEHLALTGTGVGDAGLRHLKGLTNLVELELDGLQVTDTGLGHLKVLMKLGILRVNSTNVTTEGLTALQQALPNLRIHGP